MEPDFDVLIIGSGFGGSVSALRLTEKGYKVGVLEAGRRFADDEFAKTSWRLREFLWAPRLGCYGIQRIHLLRNVMILAGAGVGGGSLNYANTLYVPPDPFFNDPQWKNITDWRAELMPHYDQAQRMLGVVKNPTFTDADRIMKEVADEMGVGDTFTPTPVGVFFGPDGEKTPGKTVPDPYFGGAGPARTGCIECGECMTGCRHGAKNTLVKNYLGLAERAGAQVFPMTTVTGLRPTSRRQSGRSTPCAPAGGPARTPGRSPRASSSWPPAHGAPRTCCSRCATPAGCRSCRTSSACSPAPTRSPSSAPDGWRPVPIWTSPTGWRSRRRSIPAPTPMSNPCATARAPTRWACCRR